MVPRLGAAWQGAALGAARRGRLGRAWQGWARQRLGWARRGSSARQAWPRLGGAGRGMARHGHGRAGVARHGSAGRGGAWRRRGMAGVAGLGTARRGQGSAAAGVARERPLTQPKGEISNGNKTDRPPADEAQVVINQIGVEQLQVPIIGTAPLIVHRFAEKAKRQMLDNMQGRKSPKIVEGPRGRISGQHLLDSRIWHRSGSLKRIAFKDATVGGARFYLCK